MSKRSKVQRQTTQELNEDEEVQFDDGEQIMKMSVDRDGNESYCTSSDSNSGTDDQDSKNKDHEVSFWDQSFQSSRSRSENRTDQSQDDSSTSQSTAEDEASEDEENPEGEFPRRYGQKKITPSKSQKTTRGQKSHAEKLQAIDEEMKTKLSELQELMEQDGLSASANMIGQHLLPKLNDRGKNSNGNATLTKKNTSKIQKNNVPGNKVTDSSISKETLYDRAVMNRDSNSSDDGVVNTSNEMITVEFNNLNVESPKFPGSRTVRRGEGDVQEPEGRKRS